MCSKYWRLAINFILLLVLVVPFLLVLRTGQAYGAPVLDLQLDAPQVIRWDISNIAPGDTGVQFANLHNTGNITSYVYIWIDDLVDGEGENPESETGDTSEPGELSHYISLDIINEGMKFKRLSGTGQVINIILPIVLNTFPSNSYNALYIESPPIEPGETLELQWQWEFLPTAGNEAQGDTVSFSIYYVLGPYQSGGGSGGGGVGGGGGGVSPPEEEPDLPTSDETPVSTDDETIPARKYVSDDGRCIIDIPKGLHVITDSGEELEYVIIDIAGEIPPVPEPFILITPLYKILVHTEYSISEGTRLKLPVMLTIYYDTDKIPENSKVYIFSYNPDSGWVMLYSSGDPSCGFLTTWVNYLNLVAVSVIVEPTYEIPVEPDIPIPEDITPAPEAEVDHLAADVMDTEVMPDNLAPLRQASLGVAVSGCIAMAVLAFIQRRRRMSVKGSSNKVS